MYTLIVLLAICSVGFSKSAQEAHLSPDQSAKLLQYSMQCMGETGVNPEALIQMRSGKFSDDEAFQKFIYCVLRKTGLASKDGHVKVEKTLDKYPKNVDKEGIKKALEECNMQSGKSPIETTFKIFKCFHGKTPVHLAL